MKKIVLAYALDDGELNITREDARKLTHINIAFGIIKDGEILTGQLRVIHDVEKLKEFNPELKISLSLGSATADDFSVGCSTEEKRKKLAASCARTVAEFGLDGIDLDWEFPCITSNFGTASPEDKANFTLVCREIRESLDRQGEKDGKHYLFTIAAGGDEYYTRNTQMDQVARYLDYVYLMTYDLRCGFHSLTGHHTNLYPSSGDAYRTSCQTAVSIFHKAGVPLEKIVIGAAAYSRQWEQVPDRNHGLFQTTESSGGYGPRYDELVKSGINQNGYIRYWDDEAKAPYLFNGSTLISYDDEESVREKCAFINRTGCGGIFYWQYYYDTTGALLDVMDRNLNQIPVYKDPRYDTETRIADLISRMTLEEKARQLDYYGLNDMVETEGDVVGGECGKWRILEEKAEEIFGGMGIGAAGHTNCSPEINNAIQKYAAEKTRLGIPVLLTTEALHGTYQAGCTIFPQQIALASTWEPELGYQTGEAIAAETRSLGYHETWTPVLDLGRDPRWGRVEEGYGEDTCLASRFAAAMVKGLQGDDVSRPDKVISEPKHFSAYGVPVGGLNCAAAAIGPLEHYATYLPVFEAAFVEGGAISTMCSYSSVDGIPCSADRKLLTDVLRGEWGMRGYVRSDMCAVSMLRCDHDVAENEEESIRMALEAGVDMQLFDFTHELYQDSIVKLVNEGRLSMETVDRAVGRVLRTKFMLGLFENPYVDTRRYRQVVRCEKHRQLALDVARKAVCLLKNQNGLLPLPKKGKKIAVIGPSAAVARLGDYCPEPRGFEAVSLLDGIRHMVSPETEVIYAKGCDILDGDILPVPAGWLTSPDGSRGLRGEYYNSDFPEGEPVLVRTDEQIDFNWIFSKPSEAVDSKCFSVKWSGVMKPDRDFDGNIGISSMDSMQLWIDGRRIVDAWGQHDRNTRMEPFRFEASREYAVEVRYRNDERGARIIFGWNHGTEDRKAAVEAAAGADVVILAVGDSTETCGEGFDRADLNLPGKQPELVRAVCAVGKPVVLVLLNGRPLSLLWESEHIPAIVEAWYPGEKGGDAIAEVLFGDVNPSGRLPMSFPKSVGQLPVHYSRRPAGGKKYIEMDRKPLYPFGYGLSYTEFSYSSLRLSAERIPADGEVTVSFDVTNTGDRDGDEVAQLYVRDFVASVVHPYMEMKGFKRVHLKAGETKRVEFRLGFNELKVLNADYVWRVEPGKFKVMAGPNAEYLPLSECFEVAP